MSHEEPEAIEEDPRPRIIKISAAVFYAIVIIGYFTLPPDWYMALTSGMITLVFAFSPVIIFWACE